MTETTNRHLRHKLQSLGRRLDELEEAKSKLQKAEDELLDIQDKIIQAEGSNSALLSDVEAMRKRLLKIEGKDEEVRKAEDLCREVREKLDQEERHTKELKVEIERLQRRMSEVEKLEEAFGKSKSDCTQLCLSLNEEKNLTKKLSSELETLKARVKEVDSSEARLDRAEKSLTAEMEKLKSLTQTFVSERKRLLERQREDEKIILKLTEKLERQKLGTADHSQFDSRDLRIEDELSTGLTCKLARKKSFDYLKHSDDSDLRNESENEKNSLEGQEDNKVKDLSQEVERLKNRLKQLELVEEDLKNMESKNSELIEKYQQERSRNQTLHDQVEQMKIQLSGCSNGNGNTTKVLENGKAENEEINVRGGFRQEKPKLLNRSPAAETVTSKCKSRDVSPQQRRETKLKNKDLCHSTESSPKTVRRAVSPAHNVRKGLKTGASSTSSDNGTKDAKKDEKLGSVTQSSSSTLNESKKASVLSRYPPAANDQKSWKPAVKQNDSNSKKSRTEKFSRYPGSDSESSTSDVTHLISARDSSIASPDKGLTDPESNNSQNASSMLSLSKANGSYTAYRSHVSSSFLSDHGSDGHSSASETESTGSRRSGGEQSETILSSTSVRTSSMYPRNPLQESNSDGTTKGTFSEDQHKPHLTEGETQETTQTTSGIEIRRVCSPREALRSKAIIKQAIVEIDRKEMMSGGVTESLTTSGKPKISTKPVVPNKMTSSITFYPNDPSSSRTSSRSSSLSSEPHSRERHTSTSNIVISPSIEHRGSISIPYEISIPKSEITLRPNDTDLSEPHSFIEAPVEATHFSLQSSETSDFNNDESGFESNTTLTNWRSQSHNHFSYDDSLPEMRNVTVRSTWRSRGAVSVDESGRALRQDVSEDEGEPATTWKAYRATTVLDTASNSSIHSNCGVKPSPAEVYMRRISNSVASVPEPGRRNKKTPSPERAIAHEPVSAQQLQPRGRKPMSVDDREADQSPWRRQAAGDMDSYERSGSRETWSSRGRAADGSRPRSNRHLDN